MKNALIKKHFLKIIFLFLLINQCSPKSNIEILPLSDQSIPVNRTFIMDIIVSNPGNEQLFWEVDAPTIIPQNYRLEANSTGATFRWTPLSSQIASHAITFTAKTSTNSATASVVITVNSAEGAPIFIQPGDGNTFDLTRNPCITVNIEVKDDDSNDIEIRVIDPIEGGELKINDPKTATWGWCPTPEQVNASERYVLKLEADDGTHIPTQKVYNIILRGEEKPDCPGDSPVIESLIPSESDLISTVKDYEVKLTASDDKGIKEDPVLYYTLEQPSDMEKPDVTQMKQIIFSRFDLTNWNAFIPNLNLEKGEQKTIYYVVSVKDDDDSEGIGCDHRVDSKLMQFNVQTPDEEDLAKYCEQCSRDTQCESGVCIYTTEPFCGADCGEGCEQGTCQEIISVDGIVTEQCVPENLNCSGLEECIDDYENHIRATARTIYVGDSLDLKLCAYTSDYYVISLMSNQNIQINVSDFEVEKIYYMELYLLNKDGTIINSPSSSETEIKTCISEVDNPYYIEVSAVFAMPNNSTSYSLDITESSEGCCEDDQFEPNDMFEASKTVAVDTNYNAQLCPDDSSDWYTFTINESKHFKIIVNFNNSQGDVDLKLFNTVDDQINEIAASLSSYDDQEIIEQDLTQGTYYIKIFSYSHIDNSYSFNMELSDNISGCRDSNTCESGTICDPYNNSCIDDQCSMENVLCPENSFCPEQYTSYSSCVNNCNDDSQCRDGYVCKPFSEGKGCALVRTNGETGDPCTTFEECGGERICLETENGYCAKIGCSSNDDCPWDSVCVQLNTGENVCLKDCSTYFICTSNYSCECVMDVELYRQWVCMDFLSWTAQESCDF